MKHLGSALVSALALAAFVSAARGDEASDLLFFSGDLMSRRSFAGIGWLHAASGLDSSGPIFQAELGDQPSNRDYGQGAAGWRYSQPGLSATFLGGAEFAARNAPVIRPLASGDLWWEPARDWMATAQIQATPAYVYWRIAALDRARSGGLDWGMARRNTGDQPSARRRPGGPSVGGRLAIGWPRRTLR
jgi:hypothetical protein